MRQLLRPLSVVLLLALLVAPPLRGQTAPLATSPDEDGLQIFVVGADDLAVAASIVSIASGLKSLFGGSDADYGKVLDGIARLEKDNGKILTLLTRALAILENIDVIVAREVREGFLVDLRTDINSSIEVWRETAAALVKDPGYRPDATKIFAKLYEDQFRRLSRKIAGYGPGIFPTYGELMAYEYAAGKFLKRNKAEREAAFMQYVARFDEFLNPKRPDSVQAAFDRATELVKQINAGLNAADAELAKNRVFTLQRGREFSRRCGGGMLGLITWKKDLMARVDGDRRSGYSYSEYWGPEYDRQADCEPRDPRCRVCFALGQVKAGAVSGFSVAALPADPGWSSPSAKVNWLQSLRSMEVAANSDLELATHTLKAAKAYSGTAKAWLEEIRK